MLKPHIVLISRREDDSRFFSSIACRLGFSFTQVCDRESLRAIFHIFPASVVIWDIEHPDPAASKNPNSRLTIEETLRKLVAPSRVFALSDHHLSRSQALFVQVPFFQHNITRRYVDPAADVIACLIIATLVPHPIGIKRFFHAECHQPGPHHQTLAAAGVAVDAVDAFFSKKGHRPGWPARVAAATDRAADERHF